MKFLDDIYESPRAVWYLFFLICILLALAMFFCAPFRSLLTSTQYKDLAPWVQAVVSFATIVAAILIAQIPLKKQDDLNKKEKEDLRHIFWLKSNKIMVKEVARVRDIKKSFDGMLENYYNDEECKKHFYNIIKRLMMLQSDKINDYVSALDYHRNFLKSLINAQDKIGELRRKIDKSTLASWDVIGEDYFEKATQRYTELKADWFILKNSGVELSEHGKSFYVCAENLIGDVKSMKKELDSRYRIDKKIIPLL